jgi:hypothetical protein
MRLTELLQLRDESELLFLHVLHLEKKTDLYGGYQFYVLILRHIYY